MLTWAVYNVIINTLAHIGLHMTFSEFIKTYALQAYLDYCKRNSLKPKVDVVDAKLQKLCALVKPKANE